MVFICLLPGRSPILTLGLTRILFASDVHGSDPVWKKFIRGAKFYKADVLIFGGDLTGKNVVTAKENPDGSFSCDFQKQQHLLKNKDELAHFDEIVRRTGCYTYVGSANDIQELSADKKKADQVFRELILQRVKEWVEYAEENATTPIYVNTGNDDELEVDEVLSSGTKVILPEDKVVMIGSKHEMISAGFSNITPWHCPRDLEEEEMARRLDRKIGQLKDPSNAIFNFHCPPVDSGLDTCPKLDTSVFPPRPFVDGGGIVLFGAGSTSVRAAIEKYQPLIGLHGHIHESRNVARIGRTFCVNPGSEYGEGILRAVLINVDDSRFKSYQFVGG